ncbi:MAG: hypothetical protein HKN23_07765, partial [Verrucomicrobiales bacterium]|nr:hypothetical protein [Verrucomicrobiales bacterium]
EQFLTAGGEFDNLCRTMQNQSGTVFYFLVNPDSFETYLDARAKVEFHRIKGGWNIWAGEKFEGAAAPLQTTARYNFATFPADEYMKLATAIGPKLAAASATEIAEFDQRLNAAADKAVADKVIKAEEKQEFIDKLRPERRAWNSSNTQQWSLNVYRTALAAQEVSGVADVQVELHPPEIPHIRTFNPASPPSKPRPPADPNAKKPAPKTGPKGATVILD